VFNIEQHPIPATFTLQDLESAEAVTPIGRAPARDGENENRRWPNARSPARLFQDKGFIE
jgi:hypothetical protein